MAQCNHLVHKRAKRGRRIRGKGVLKESLGPDYTNAGFDDGGEGEARAQGVECSL